MRGESKEMKDNETPDKADPTLMMKRQQLKRRAAEH
jgi:hypothetical protein